MKEHARIIWLSLWASCFLMTCIVWNRFVIEEYQAQGLLENLFIGVFTGLFTATIINVTNFNSQKKEAARRIVQEYALIINSLKFITDDFIKNSDSPALPNESFKSTCDSIRKISDLFTDHTITFFINNDLLDVYEKHTIQSNKIPTALTQLIAYKTALKEKQSPPLSHDRILFELQSLTPDCWSIMSTYSKYSQAPDIYERVLSNYSKTFGEPPHTEF